MKRLWAALAALMLLLTLTVLPAQASEYDYVNDRAGLLSDAEWSALETRASELSQELEMNVMVLTVNGTGGQAIRYFAADYYDDYCQKTSELGHSGVMLTLDMVGRDWYILTTGTGIQAFTDYGIQRIGEDITPDLSAGRYASAFNRFMDDARVFVQAWQAGDPFDVNHEYNGEAASAGQRFASGLPVPGLIAALVTLIGMKHMKSGMHTVRRQHGARRYAREDSLQITRANELFMYHTQTRQKLPEPDRSSSGGGSSSTFTSSSGVSHGGGGGKF